MTPHLTTSGRTLLVMAATLIMVGAGAGAWSILLMGETVAVVVMVLYFLQLANLLAVEESFVTLAVSADALESVGGTVGRKRTLELALLNRSSLTFHELRLTPEFSSGLVFEPAELVIQRVGPWERVRMEVEVVSSAPGRRVLHGFRLRADGAAGIIRVSNYLATPLPLKFTPRVSSARGGLPQSSRRSTDVRLVGTHHLVRRGFGSDFRELRDHQHGDPFRAIAWKATARTGRLMVRDFHDEVIANAFVILDISSTMRGGTPPRTKLAHAVELTTQFVSGLAKTRDRVGLITFDEVVYGHLRTADARKSLAEVMNHLVGVISSITDPDFTEYDDDEVAVELAKYLKIQERLDFTRNTSEIEPLNRPLLEQWLTQRMPREIQRLGDRSLQSGVVNAEGLDVVRRFCQLRDVNIPYRYESRFGAKEKGMVAALERFLDDKREKHFVLLISDLCGIVDPRAIVKALTVATKHGHRIVVLMPYTPEYVVLPGADELSPEVHDRLTLLNEIFRLAERRERGRICRSFAKLGVRVVAAGPNDTMASLMRRL